MSVIFLVLPLAIVMAGAAVLAFIWAVQGGQFDDLDTPALRVAIDEDTSSETAVVERRPHDP